MKITSVLLLILLLTSLIPVFSTYENGKISITIDKTAVSVGDYFEAVIRVENIKAEFIIAPIHFNSKAVKVSDKDGGLVLSGVKTAAESHDGSIGITLMQALNGDPSYWNGAVFENPAYPEIDNENGFYRLMFSNTRAKEITSEALISIKFLAIGEGAADIRFATNQDSFFDLTAEDGAKYIYKDLTNPFDSSVSLAFPNAVTPKLNVRLPNITRKTIKNISDEELTGTSIIVAYDGNKLVDISIKTISVPINKSDIHECDIGVKENEIKHFLFGNFTNLMPLTGVADIE